MKFPRGDHKNKYETSSDISEIAMVMAKSVEEFVEVEVDLSGNYFLEVMQSSWRCRQGVVNLYSVCLGLDKEKLNLNLGLSCFQNIS